MYSIMRYISFLGYPHIHVNDGCWIYRVLPYNMKKVDTILLFKGIYIKTYTQDITSDAGDDRAFTEISEELFKLIKPYLSH